MKLLSKAHFVLTKKVNLVDLKSLQNLCLNALLEPPMLLMEFSRLNVLSIVSQMAHTWDKGLNPGFRKFPVNGYEMH